MQEAWDGLATWKKVLAWILVGSVLLYAISGLFSSKDYEGFRATPSEIEALVLDKVGDDADPQAECDTAFDYCSVSFVSAQSGYTSQWGMLDEQRELFQILFSDPKLKEAKLVTRGETETTGGKTSISPIIATQCSRAAARQIDWENIDPANLPKLCDYSELVNGVD